MKQPGEIFSRFFGICRAFATGSLVAEDRDQSVSTLPPAFLKDRARRFGLADALVLGALLAVVLFYFRSLIHGEYIYGELDIRRSIYLFRKVSYELMQDGQLPLWIPYLYCGMPLLASFLVTPFYPVDIAFMLARVPLNAAFNWDLLIHLAAAQVFSFLFFKRLFRSRMGAVFCSMWFWNAFFLNSVGIGDALNIRAMLLVPAVFYFVEAALDEHGRPVYFLFGSLAVSLQILSGGVQFAFYTMVAVAAYAGFLILKKMQKREDVKRPLLGFATMIIVALAIASVQLVPQWEYARQSLRAVGISWFRVWAIKPHQLLSYVIAMFEGKGQALGYFGIAPLVLAAYSLLFWRVPRKYFFLLLGTISIVYSFGGNTLVSSYIGGLPLVRGFRGPFRASILFNLSVFVLAGGALAGCFHPGTKRAKRRALGAFALLSLLLVAGFAAAAKLSLDYSNATKAGIVSSGVFLALSIPAAYVLFFSGRLRSYGALAFVCLLAADLAVHYRSSYSPIPVADLFAKDETVGYLEKNLNSSRIAVYNTADSNYFGLFGIESANGHHPFPAMRYSFFLPLLENPKIASLAGVKYNLYYKSKENGQPYNPPVANENEVSVKRLQPAPLPRAFMVTKYKVLSSSEVLNEMKQNNFDPGKEVILESEPVALGSLEGAAPAGRAAVNSDKPNEVSVEADSKAGGILVLRDSYYPGWRAEVDGERAELLEADYVFRAVPLPEGKHTVVFRFMPISFYIGAIISCLGVILWLDWALLLRKGKLF